MIYTYRDIIQKISNDWDMNDNDYDTLNWHQINTKPKPTKEELDEQINYHNNIKPFEVLREERNKKLDETDKYLTSDFVYPSGVTKQNWLDYRQALRDLPSNSQPEIDENGNLINVEWPTPPTT